MKKFLEEAFKIFWIPLIMAVVSYIFFTLKDVMLGIIVLVALSAAYTLIRLYVSYKKWWLLIILMVVLVASIGAYFFRAPTTSLTINGDKVTSGEVSINGGGGKVQVSPAPSNGMYTKGAVITLTATAGAGQDWKSWVGTENDNTNPTTVKMNGKMEIRVNFESRFSLIINNQMVIGSFMTLQEGSITIDPPPEGDGKYTSGTEVHLSVRSNTGYDWKSWSGTASDNTNPTTVIMSGGNKNVNINFEGRFTLNINDHLVIGPSIYLGQGSVNIDPAPGPDDKYAYGTKITLTADPELGYGWKSWTGTGNDGTNPAVVTINSEKHIAVSFEERYLVMINNQPLSQAILDLLGGTVSSNPSPGADSRFTKNSVTMLKAVPDAGYRFDRWTGDVSDTVTGVNIMMNNNKNIAASFIKVYNLTSSVNTPGSGTISPAQGIYDTGTEITIKAAPADGYRFDKWSGDASGNTESIKLTFADDIAVMAEFIKTFTLTATVSPAGSGMVSPAGGTFDTGTVVTIEATPADGYSFSGWEGDISGNMTSANVTMDKNINVTAKFTANP